MTKNPGGGTQDTDFNKGFTKGILTSSYTCFFYEGNIAGTSSEMTRRRSRRVISKEKTGGHRPEGPKPEGH